MTLKDNCTLSQCYQFFQEAYDHPLNFLKDFGNHARNLGNLTQQFNLVSPLVVFSKNSKLLDCKSYIDLCLDYTMNIIISSVMPYSL